MTGAEAIQKKLHSNDDNQLMLDKGGSRASRRISWTAICAAIWPALLEWRCWNLIHTCMSIWKNHKNTVVLERRCWNLIHACMWISKNHKTTSILERVSRNSVIHACMLILKNHKTTAILGSSWKGNDWLLFIHSKVFGSVWKDSKMLGSGWKAWHEPTFMHDKHTKSKKRLES